LLEFIAKYWLEALFGLILTGLSFLVRRLFHEAKTARHAASSVQTASAVCCETGSSIATSTISGLVTAR
jgi:hypothetical protein